VSDAGHSVAKQFGYKVLLFYRLWAILQVLWKIVKSHLSLWPTGSELDCTSVKGSLITSLMTNSGWVTYHICEWHSYQIFSFDQQQVSDKVAHFVEGSLITSFPITNSEWVTLHTLWKAVSSTFPMTNREWVTLHILWKIVLSHLSLWPTVGEWHYTFCKR